MRGDFSSTQTYNRQMRNRRMLKAVLLFVLAFASFAQAQRAAQFEWQTKDLPSGIVGRPYTAKLVTQNGKGPFSWQVRGDLPPGIRIQHSTGFLSGTPTKAGTYKFTVTVIDRGTGSTISREFTLEVVGLLVVKWKQPPTLNEKTISGSITVANYSRDTYDLTVVVVAVNEIGKAFALGYQHFNLAASLQQDIRFSLELPNGQYIVHADAVGEIPAKDLIRRSWLETSQRIVVNVNR